MKFENLHPAQQLAEIMSRIYQGGMTTTSGGNLSVRDENGDIWITPGGKDKGTLAQEDMCCVRADGTVAGAHKPSIELAFHTSIYKSCPDVHAIVHAHPPALVAFSATRTLPDVNLVSNARDIIDGITMAEYATPGSDVLGENIARCFESGFRVVVLENHGLVTGADNLHNAFAKLETLEFLAMLEINARRLGAVRSLRESGSNADGCRNMNDFSPGVQSEEEIAARRELINFIYRSYRRKLICSSQGTFSARLSDGSFLITPNGADRAYIEETDLVLIKNGMKEKGKLPSCDVMLHQVIFEKHPEINCIIGAQPPNAMAFAVTEEPFDSRIIPESYILLREIKKVPYSTALLEPKAVADMLRVSAPVLVCENNQIIATGGTVLEAYDRLEVMEATASSVLAARDIAEIVHISESEIRDIDKAFNLK